jgi:hypothetical protein
MRKPIFPERTCRTTIIESDIHSMLDGSVEEVIERLSAYVGSNVHIRVDYYDSCSEINIVREEWESDEDYEQRIDQYENDLLLYEQAKAQKQIDRAKRVLEKYSDHEANLRAINSSKE